MFAHVIGFDDAGPNAFFDPPLTSVQQPFEAMSSAVVQLLTGQISDAGAATPELTFRPELVVRASTGAAPETTPDGGRAPQPSGTATGLG